MTKFLQKIKLYLPLILLTIFFGLFYLVSINLFNSDIGRHIANGRIILTGSTDDLKNLLSTNYFSYTQNNYPNINHHWFFGVIAYFLHQFGGFKLLTIVNMLLNTLGFIFILLSSLELIGKKNSLAILTTTIVAFLTLPLLTHRLEVRPESFSLLFFSMFFYLFSSNKVKKNKWIIMIVLVTQILWVNTHLFFILGPLLAGFYLFKELLNLIFNKKIANILINKNIKFWFLLCLSLFLVSIINPHFLEGLLEPLNIFNNYAYKVAENQSTFFMINYGSNIKFFSYVIAISIATILLLLSSFVNKKVWSAKISELVLFSLFILISNKINRMTPFLAVVITPFLVKEFFNFIQFVLNKYKNSLSDSFGTLVLSSGGFVLLIIILNLGFFTPDLRMSGIGLLPNTFLASQFYKNNKIVGPIFNNYDIGGYLAYSLFPQEQLFIDNRPEAYSPEFITKEFLSAIKHEDSWSIIDQKYKFNVIFFYRHDAIDGAQEFLFNRVVDENWIPVFVDEFTLIFVKNNETNKSVINQFKIPREVFGFTEN